MLGGYRLNSCLISLTFSHAVPDDDSDDGDNESDHGDKRSWFFLRDKLLTRIEARAVSLHKSIKRNTFNHLTAFLSFQDDVVSAYFFLVSLHGEINAFELVDLVFCQFKYRIRLMDRFVLFFVPSIVGKATQVE